MRGSKKLNEIFKGKIDKSKNKGRDSRLINLRNEAMANRFYFYSEFTKLDYESRIETIASEFYLSTLTTSCLLSKISDTIIRIKKEKPQIRDLKKEYPFFNWNLKEINKLAA